MKTSGVFLILAFVLTIGPILGVLYGAFSGWLVSLIMDETVRGTISAAIPGLKDYQLWQIGASLGFVSAFFRSVATPKS